MSNQELETTKQAAEEPETVEAADSEVSTEATETEEEAAPPQAEETANEGSAEEAAPSTDAPEGDASESLSIHNLKPRQSLKGTVKNITDFGAFIDIGLPQDGLVHISELAKRKVEKVTDVVEPGQEVDIWVKRIDKKRGRISLTMVKPIGLRLRDIADDSEIEGAVTRLEPYGAFVDIGSERYGLVHISQITHDYIKHPEDTLTVGETVKVKVLKVNRKKRQVDLSIKALLPPPVEVQKVEEAKEVRKVKEIAGEVEQEDPVPTAMALAYAAMQTKSDADDSGEDTDFVKDKHKRKNEMNEIVARTLATSE